MGESTVTLNKPIFDGQCTLDNAKVTMYDVHYGYMKPKYGDNVDLCCTDTDSFIYEIRTEDFYDAIREDVPKMFDTFAYPDDHPSGIRRMNKKVPGMMKDEAAGRIITEIVGLKAKMYAYKIDEYDGMCEKEFCDGRCGKKECVGNGGKNVRVLRAAS